jgi:hypothetical protein
MTKDEYIKNISGYHLVGCGVRNAQRFYFVARNDRQANNASAISEAGVDKRVIEFFLDVPLERRMGRVTLSGLELVVGSVAKFPIEQMVVVDSMAEVYAVGSGVKGVESAISKFIDKKNLGAISRVRTIGGYVYAVGSAHTVCRRLGKNDWESLNFNLRRETREDFDDEDQSNDMFFQDIAGFSENDLYTIAGRGVVWHCDGKKWMQVPFPSNMNLHSVCCAGDGNVYIGAQSGTLFCGRDNRWKMIHKGEFSLPFKDIVWHAGKVWCTSDYGLWTMENGKLVVADVPDEIKVCSGHLSVADGVMLMAGHSGAAFHDGKKWQVIFNKFEMES